MPSFSERMGLIEPRSIIQTDSMDQPLRNNLWDIVEAAYLLPADHDFRGPYTFARKSDYPRLWANFFHETIDQLPRFSQHANRDIRRWYFDAAWNEIYDFLEFVIADATWDADLRKEVRGAINARLEQHLSGYRLVSKEFAPITDDAQVRAIEDAMASPLVGVRSHLSRALELVSDKPKPDPANSIKEAISAVESLCGAIVGKKATLGEAIKKLEANGIKIHPALEKGWLAIYGYTSDENGIRHAMQEEPNLTAADAVYFIASCSAFIGLLTDKARAAGIELSPVA